MFQDDLKKETKTIQDLNSLALFPDRAKSKYRQTTDSDLLAIKARLSTRINKEFAVVARKNFAEQTGMNGIVNIDGWTISYSKIVYLLSKPNYNMMHSLIATQRAKLVKEILANERLNYKTTIVSKGNNLNTVKSSIAFEVNLKRHYKQILDTDSFVQFAAARVEHRKKIMSGASTALVKLIKKLPHQTATENFAGTYLLSEDKQNPLAKNIFSALERQVDLVAPFNGQKISFYLNALYSYDYEKIIKSDNEFFSEAKQAANMLAPGMDAIGAIAELFSRGLIKRKNLSKSFKDSVANQSMIAPLMAVYLLEYSHYYSKCYDKPVKMQTREQWYTSTTQGGVEINRYYDDPIIKEYLVNKKFVPIFEKVGLTKVNNSTRNMFEHFLKGSGKLYIQDIVKGTRNMMSTSNCKSKKKRKMEDQMIRYFYDYNSRISAAKRQLFAK